MNLPELKGWIHNCALESSCHTKKIPFSKSLEWNYDNEVITHKSNRFFKVIGVEWENSKNTHQQLLMDQWEIGTLGFILHRNKNGNEILIQAKVEPGNVGLAQIAPTCQATRSNLDQVHGGTSPLFANFFNSKNTLSVSLQSEQGTRFFNKRNKNVIVVENKKLPTPPNFKWVKVRLLCQALAQNYLVNTDSRSVLVTSDWQKLVRDEIFNQKDKFVQELKRSYLTNTNILSSKKILSLLNKLSENSPKTITIPIGKVKSFTSGNTEINSKNKDGFKIIHIKVQTKNREIEKWDQPFIKSYKSGNYILYSGRFNKILYFCFELWEEPGLYNHVELGPLRSSLTRGKTIKSCWQSDEGGRFFKDKSKYSLIDVGQIKKFNKNLIWLNLKQVQELSMREGIFCNEARSAISLILSMI